MCEDQPPRRGAWLTAPEFDAAVDAAIDRIPDILLAQLSNVALLVEDRYVPPPGEDPATELLGLYEGTPLTDESFWDSGGNLPNRITLYRQSILAACGSREEVVEQVAVTVLHEVAHHFGISDERLAELGWA